MNPLLGRTNHVNSVAFSSDRRYTVSGSHDRTLRVWHLNTGQSFMDHLKAMVIGLIQLHSPLMGSTLFLALMTKQLDPGIL